MPYLKAIDVKTKEIRSLPKLFFEAKCGTMHKRRSERGSGYNKSVGDKGQGKGILDHGDLPQALATSCEWKQ